MAPSVRTLAATALIVAALFVSAALSPRVLARSSPPPDIVQLASGSVVQLAPGSAVQLATPPFLVQGKRYAFTWSGGGPSQTYLVKAIRPDGWILVDAADETLRPDQYVPGEFPQRWLHVGLAISIQEMRDLP